MIPPPGVHGGDGPRLAAALGVPPSAVLDLSVSLNPFAPDVAALAATSLKSLRHYPDAVAATAALADAIGVVPARLLVTNGGAEAIALVAAGRPAGRVDEPEFSLYRRHLASVAGDAPAWRSNPHNPSGRLAGPSEQAAVWDEAFYPLATGRWTRGDRDTIVVGSLTKLFACPGLRLGYVVSDDTDFVEWLRRRQPAWSVGSLALDLLPRMLATADLASWAAGIAVLRRQLSQLLSSFGFGPQPSDANWLLVEGGGNLRTRLAPMGILVRDATSFGLPGWARVAVPDETGLDRLAAALAASA